MRDERRSDPAAPTSEGVTKIAIRDLVVDRDEATVLRVPKLSIAAGRVTAVIGPNGSGKSTLLATLELLVAPREGALLLDGVEMRTDVLATRRRMAAAFQDPLLLSMSVRKNVETALRLRKVPRGARRARALRWLERFGVGGLAERHAHELSGGEAQRVSLARAFALEPEVLLLDEPFSALDAPTRAALLDDFAAIVAETRPTTVLVTHDRDEALRLADDLVVLIDGEVRQGGAPTEVFAAPADRSVADFVGVENVWLSALVREASGVATYRAQSGELLDVVSEAPAPVALVCVRPEEITVSPRSAASGSSAEATSARNQIEAVVTDVMASGALLRLVLQGSHYGLGENEAMRIVATVSRPSLENLGLVVGTPVLASFKATAAHAIAHD